MKYLFTVFFSFLLILSSVIYSQTSKEILQEANTEYVFVQDVSPYAAAQKELTALRNYGSEQAYISKLNQLKLQFPDKFVKAPAAGSDVLRSSGPDPNKQNIPADEADWIAGGDIQISGNSLSGPTSGNPTPNNRLIRMAADSSGALFVAYIDAARDTLHFYRSTDRGMHWDHIIRIEASPDKYQGFDIAVADAEGGTGSKIGLTVSLVPEGNLYNGSVFYAEMFSDGTLFTPWLVEAASGDMGKISPCITTDGWNKTPATTNWYIAYQSTNILTGVTAAANAALTPDWGTTWQYDVARSSFNDYELDINYNFNSDSIYVLLTNNLTTTNPNLRLRWLALSDWGTTVAWKQFNPATTSSPEFDGQLAVNQVTKQMVVTYTISSGGVNNVNYSYTLSGVTAWITGNSVVSQSNNLERVSVYSLQQQVGSFRIAFVSRGVSFDSVLYYNTADISTGFTGRQLVNQNNASSSLKPVLAAGYYPSEFAAVAFAGFGNSGVYADGTDIITEISQQGNIVPNEYKLEQNYPNPFNPATKISFSIPKNQFVTLKIYSALGKEIVTLINQELTKGQFDITLNSGNLGSGVYFYTLTTEDFAETKKMILLK